MGDPLLPQVTSDTEFEGLRRHEDLWVPAMQALASRHGLAGELHLFPTGSVVVFIVGERHVIKLHTPWNATSHATERYLLEALAGRLPVASPELVASGHLEGWGYLVMTRLPGLAMGDAWDRIPPPDRLEIAEMTGRLAAALHQTRVPGFEPFIGWDEFIAQRRGECSAQHLAYGLPDHLASGLEDQLRGVDLSVADPVLLHTELTDVNLLVARDSRGRWRLSGVFDFEPSMKGHPFYDLPALTIFVARGVPALCRAALLGFGVTRLDAHFRRTLLACTLLHRYSHLTSFLATTGHPIYPDSWDEMSRWLFGW